MIFIRHEVFGLQRAELLDAPYGNIDARDTDGSWESTLAS